MKAYDQIKMENVKSRMAIAARGSRFVVLGLFGAFVVIVSVIFFASAERGEWASDSAGLVAFCNLSGLMLAAMMAATLVLTLRSAVGDHKVGPSFSLVHSRWFFALGVLLVAFAALEAAGFAYASYLAGQESATPFALTSIQLAVIHIDILFILAAIVSFYLSHVFKYGAFLQWMYDETA